MKLIKIIYSIIVLLLLCSTISPYNNLNDKLKHHMIVVVVWDEDGNPESNVDVIFEYKQNEIISKTSEDGSVIFNIQNFGNIEEENITVSCKYGIEKIQILYNDLDTGITFNEPSEEEAINYYWKLGFIAIPIGGGLYLLKRRRKNMNNEDNKRTFKLKSDFGVRALIAVLSIIGYIVVSGIAVYNNNLDMIEPIANLYMPIIMIIIGFYYTASMMRDIKK